MAGWAAGEADNGVLWVGQKMNDYIVKDINLPDFGRQELNIVETEMPSFIPCRIKFGDSKLLKGARITAKKNKIKYKLWIA